MRKTYKIEVKREKVAHWNPNKSFLWALNDEVKDWLDDNEISFWSMHSGVEMRYNMYDFYFDNENDALLFKLRWG